MTRRSWASGRYAILAACGVLGVIAIVGLVGLVLNHNIGEVTSQALAYDVELEDRGDDLHVAVLGVRHFHRNIVLAGPSRESIADFEEAHLELMVSIERLDRLGVRDPNAPQPPAMRALAEEYYAQFRPAVDRYDDDSLAFALASDRGLAQLFELATAAQEIDRLGEDLASESLTRVERATASARILLMGVVLASLVAGGLLAQSLVKVVRRSEEESARESAAAETAWEVARTKLDFLTDVSHELRTPLTVLRGNADVGRALDSSCIHAELFEEIARESARMSQMVDDLLFLVRSDAALPPLDLATVPIAPFVADLAARAEAFARERHATLNLELSGDGDIRIDASRMEQAILVLVDNAVKYGRSTGPIRLATRRMPDELLVTVADDGPGIPEGDLPHIFQRFFRGRGPRVGGFGLGLAIASTIVEAHGGHIDVRSAVGKGTEMTVHVPATGVEAEDWPEE